MDKNEYDIYNQLSGLFCNIKKGSGAAVLRMRTLPPSSRWQ